MHFGIFVTNIDVGVRRFDHPSCDQHAIDETVRIALEIVAVLERAGLPFVAIHGEQARRGLGAHQRPFAASRKAGTTETAQAGVADDPDEVVARPLAGDAVLQQRIAAGALVGVEIDCAGTRMRVAAFADGRSDALGCRTHLLHMTDSANWRPVATAHARRAHNANILAQLPGQFTQQLLLRPPWRKKANCILAPSPAGVASRLPSPHRNAHRTSRLRRPPPVRVSSQRRAR